MLHKCQQMAAHNFIINNCQQMATHNYIKLSIFPQHIIKELFKHRLIIASQVNIYT